MNGSLEQFRKETEDKNLRLGIIGPGCVGLPLAVELAGKDFESCRITPKLLGSIDRVLITTGYSLYGMDSTVKYSNCMMDARSATKNVRMGTEEIVLLGDGKWD